MAGLVPAIHAVTCTRWNSEPPCCVTAWIPGKAGHDADGFGQTP
jgi:hypothetical protein